MEIITQKSEKSKRYLPHEISTKVHAVEAYRKEADVSFTGNCVKIKSIHGIPAHFIGDLFGSDFEKRLSLQRRKVFIRANMTRQRKSTLRRSRLTYPTLKRRRKFTATRS